MKIERNTLVSVTIPSFNSEKFIPLCLEAVKSQSYSNLEILVIDSGSTDRTREIATNFGARVINCQGKLLAARYIGLKEAKGEYVLLLDTDQVLRNDCIERALGLMADYDMLVLEEESYNSEWFIPKLYQASKQIINARFRKSYAFDPLQGGNPARFFKREILEKAFERILEVIPQETFAEIIHGDHDIIYYETYQVSKKVGLLEKALWHVEPDFAKLWRTNLRYGASIRKVQKLHYWELFLKKRWSGFWFGRPIGVGFRAFLLSLILKAVQKIGYLRYYHTLHGNRA